MSDEVVERHLMRVRDVGFAEKYVPVVEAKHYEAVVAEVREANDLINRLRGYNADLTKEVNQLRYELEFAIECVESWGAYASDYFKDKYDFEGDLKRLRQALTNNGGSHE